MLLPPLVKRPLTSSIVQPIIHFARGPALFKIIRANLDRATKGGFCRLVPVWIEALVQRAEIS